MAQGQMFSWRPKAKIQRSVAVRLAAKVGERKNRP